MRLKDYIEAIGDSEAAEQLGAKERTTASWRRGERKPKPEQAMKIQRLTRGLVRFEECFDLEAEK